MATLRVSIGALTVLAVTYIVNAMDRGVFPVLLGDVDAQYRFSLATGGLLATIFTFGLGIGGLPAGYLFKRWSRKTVAVSGIIIYSAAQYYMLGGRLPGMAFYGSSPGSAKHSRTWRSSPLRGPGS